MARGFQGAIMRGFGAHDHLATVTSTEHLAPHFLRVRMNAPRLFDDATTSPTEWVRIWFPDPAGGDAEHQRAYTFSETDPETGDFACDFVLHEPAGPASAWASAAQPGDTIVVTPFGSDRVTIPEELPAGYLLVGDSASVPAINSIIRALPPELPVELYLEQHDPDDVLIPLAPHPRLAVHWAPRSEGTDALAAAIEDRDWTDWTAWGAPESTTLKHVLARLKGEFGFPKTEVKARAYWIHGRAMGKLRDDPKPAAEAPEARPQAAPEGAAAEPVAPRRGAARRTSTTSTGWRSQAGSRLIAPLKPTFIAAGVLQGLVTLVQLAPWVLLVELARVLVTGGEPATMWALGVAAVVLLGVGTLLETALLLWVHAVDARFARGIRSRLTDKLARLPLGWFDARGSGGVKKVVDDDTLALHYLTTHAVPDAVAAVVAPLAVLGYLFVADWRIALVLFVPVLVYVFTMAAMVFQSGPKIAQAGRWAERMNAEAAGYLEGQPVVRVFGGAAASTFRRRLDGYIAFLNEWQRPFTGKKTVMDLVTRPATFLWLICGMGVLLVTTGAMQPIGLIPFLLLGTTFGARLLGIGYGLGGLRDGLQAARRIQLVLDEPELGVREPEEDGADAGRADAGRADAGLVEFDHVTFGYRADAPVLHDVELRLEPGTVTAIVGPSGSGKSTLAALLARFHDVQGGGIRLDGRDLRSLTADELYARLGFVFQNPQLVAGTVHDNIALGSPDATRERVEQAAREAQLHDRILQLPDGYDTRLDGASTLSGGERQRLAIARALLSDPGVLVLDEATAFADPESEFLVQQALSRLTRGRTVLVIAHRLHTVTAADAIVVLERGRIVERGTHDALLAKDGRYRALWHARPATAEPEGATR